MSFAVGSLVRARGREWVVLPESTEDLVLVRPLGGSEDESTGILSSLETIEPAVFELPHPEKRGDYLSSLILRQAVRLGFRSSAGPFRSFGRLAVDPRPYQLVPLLMALKLDPVRLLIADDVGIGKTVESLLIARELMDRGEIQRLAVLCPPHLAEQWQAELKTKFNIEAELVLPSTARRLERNCGINESVFDIYPHVIVSMDFIKSDRHRADFVRTCPELVIVDEAHTCSYSGNSRSARHQRHDLLRSLAGDADRHLLLVTATPHSGKEDAFRSLLCLLNDDFHHLPEDLSGRENEKYRIQIAEHLVQRRRGDIQGFLGEKTPFPTRDESDLERTYSLSQPYKTFLERVVDYARETVKDLESGSFRQRVRWWSALALMRSVASSPAAAADTLRSRAGVADTETAEGADEVGTETVMDLADEGSAETIDVAPGSDIGEYAEDEESNRRLLLRLAREADNLKGKNDNKLQGIKKIVTELIKDGYRPIVFCRFIPTAEYVAEELRAHLGSKTEVMSVTGLLPPAERESRVLELAAAKKCVLVCTDCLSEGINLQEHFDSVVHYDLSWNPTRHEQREGRVDRYGQSKKKVKVVTYYGTDNHIDGIVLDVLLRKHKQIKNSLGISVPVPEASEHVIEAIFEGLLLKEQASPVGTQQYLPGFEEYLKPKKDDLHRKWELAAKDTEKRSFSRFAQQTIKVEDVAAELKAIRDAIGSPDDIPTFIELTIPTLGGFIDRSNGTMRLILNECPTAVRELVDQSDELSIRFEKAGSSEGDYIHRTHPFIEGLASYVLTTSLDPKTEGDARRCGVIITSAVDTRTTLLLLRLRYHIITRRNKKEYPLLAEDTLTLGFKGAVENPNWLDEDAVHQLLGAKPSANVAPERARDFLQKVVDGFDSISEYLNQIAEEHGKQLLDAHRRVRTASKMKGVSYRIEPNLPADVLGIYVYLPDMRG